MKEVWGYDFCGETNLVDVYVRYLRNKIDYRFHISLIETIRGVGYIVKNESSQTRPAGQTAPAENEMVHRI